MLYQKRVQSKQDIYSAVSFRLVPKMGSTVGQSTIYVSDSGRLGFLIEHGFRSDVI